MARGGYRPGAGRPKTAKTSKAGKTPRKAKNIPADIQMEAKKAAISPLEYMLTVMNSPEADVMRRDRMAIAAAPFVHQRVVDTAPGKKDVAIRDAETAHEGSEWAGLVN